jgi:hypothetical protein
MKSFLRGKAMLRNALSFQQYAVKAQRPRLSPRGEKWLFSCKLSQRQAMRLSRTKNKAPARREELIADN